MSETLYHVSANPHVRDNGSTQKIMLDVIIALLPATIFGIYIFGVSAALTVAISVATCVVVEYIYQKLMKQPITVSNLSAALTGLLLALNLPPEAPFWMPILGGIFAIIVVKQVFEMCIRDRSFGEITPNTKGMTSFGNLRNCLPEPVSEAISEGMEYFDTKIKGFNREDTVLCGIEARTSSPLRIERDKGCLLYTSRCV